MDFYTFKYSYKYCSEILYALEECVDFNQYPFFHIFSLGCGTAPDLMAFDYIKSKRTIPSTKPILFGLDKNIYLINSHNYIIENFDGGKAQFCCDSDVLRYIQKYSAIGVNVLVIQYLISFFYHKIRPIGMKKWFYQIAQNIVAHKPDSAPMPIIINDNDSCYTGRDAALLLTKGIERLGFKVSKQRMRFGNEDYYINSRQYCSCNNYFGIPNHIKENYSTAIKCTSAQLILEVY